MKKILFTFGLGLFGIQAVSADLRSQAFEVANFNVDTGVRKGFRTDAVIVFKDGKKIFEKYARGSGPETRHIAWSVSKSVVALLYGVAIKEKKISLQDSVCKVGDLPKKAYCEMTFENLLNFSSGIKWKEEYEKTNTPLKASVLAMLYGEGRKDMAGFVSNHDLESRPGAVWRYSSGDTVFASERLAKAFQTEDLNSVFKEKIFKPLGITSAIFETDLKGTVVGASYLYITPRDLIKIGQLILNKGQWNGEQILDSAWIDWMGKVPQSFVSKRLDHDDQNVPGSHMWVNKSGFLPNGKRPIEALPEDTLFLLGHWGQYVFVSPSLKLVAVRVGDTRDGSFDSKTFGKSLAEFVKEDTK